jgi:hypothetical protein
MSNMDMIVSFYQDALKAVPEDVPDGQKHLVACSFLLADALHTLDETLSEADGSAHLCFGERSDDDEEDEDIDPVPVLSGKNPVSLLMELCQAREIAQPVFNIDRSGGDDHIPTFGGQLSIVGVGTVKGEGYKSKQVAKTELARKILVEKFGAKDSYRRSK